MKKYRTELATRRALFGMDESFLPYYTDNGCQTATLYLRILNKHENAQCTACPLPQCIDDLDYYDKKVLNQSKELREIFNLYDNGINIKALAKRFKINYIYIDNCIKNRENIQSLLDRWSDILQTQEQADKFQIVKV